MPNFFIDRPIFAWVVAIFLVIAGVLSIPMLPVAQYPTVAPTTIEITATYPGADARTLDESVTSLVEQELNGAPGLLYYQSSSSGSGRASISAVFVPGTDPALAQVEVQNRIRRVESRLPQPVLQQGLQVDRANAGFLLVASLSSDDPDTDRVALGDYIARNIINEVRRVPGVGSAQLFAPERAMRIWTDPARLEGLGLQPGDVVAAIREQNAQVAAGTLGDNPAPAGQPITATVTVDGQLTTPEAFGNIILRANPDGSSVRLRDVARVEVGSETYQFSAYQDGLPTAAFAVQLGPDANALDTSRGVREVLDRLSADFPPGVTYDVPYDTAPFVEISIRTVVETLVIAAILVFLVMFLFLQNIRYTLIPTITVPISLLAMLAVMLPLGFSINVLTMFGMVLAIGILVDDAIIVVENTERIMAEEGLGPKEATRKAMGQITGAIVGITLTMVAVFLPLAFMAGSTGVIYRQFSMTMVVSIVISSFLALSLSPAMCASLLKRVGSGEEHQREVRSGPLGLLDRFFNAFNHHFSTASRGYTRRVGGVVARSGRFVVIYIAIVAVMALLFVRLPTAFLPTEDQGSVLVDIQLPANASSERTREVTRQVEDYFIGPEASRGDPDAERSRTQEAVRQVVMINGFSFSGTGPNAGLGFVILEDWAKRGRDQSAQAIAQQAIVDLFVMGGVRDGTVFTVVPPAIQGLGTSGGFDFRLQDRSGAGYEALRAAADELMGLARQSERLNPGAIRETSLPPAQQIRVDIDRERATALGLSITDINQTLQVSLGSALANDFPNLGRMQRVIVQADGEWRMSPEALLRLSVRNRDGEMVPMSSFASIDWTLGPVAVSRFNGYPSVSISGEGAPGVSSGEAMDEMVRLMQQLPPGFGFEWAGQSLQEQQAGNQAPLLIALSVIVVFLVLAALYESWAIPFAAIMTVPLAVVGAVLAVMVVGLPNDVFFKVGLLTIMGLSARMAILIIEFAKDLYAQGMPLHEAAVEAARLRFRPILMTTLSFCAGVLPLAIATGAASASQRAVGVGVLGGMVSAIILGIFLVPVFFVVVTRLFRVRPDDVRVLGEPVGTGEVK